MSLVDNNHKGLKENYAGIAMLILCIFQFCFICYANLMWSSHIIDGDMADLYVHVREMWRSGSVIIKGWNYSTTLEIDCSALLALPIYGMTKDIFLSFAISNIIFVLLWYFVIYLLVINCGGSNTAAFLAIDLVMIPYSIGMLEYFNMLFINGGQYTIKALIPLIFLCIITGVSRNNRFTSFLLFIVLAILQLVTSISSGVYVLVSGIFPIAIYLVLSWMNNHSLYAKKQVRAFIVTLLNVLLCSVAGMIIAKYCGVVSRGEATEITGFNEFLLNAQTAIAGLFEVLGCAAIYSGDVSVFSLTGLTYLLKAVATLLVLISAICVQTRFLSKKKNSYRKLFLLSCMLPWNIFIFIFADTRYSRANIYMEYRYYLIAFIPAIILTGIMLEKYIRHVSVSIATLILASVMVLTLGCDGKVPQFRKYSDEIYDIRASINELPIDVGSVFFIGDDDTPRKMRLIDETRTYCVINDNGVIGISDNYIDYNSKFTQKNCVLCLKDTTPADHFQNEISDTYTKIGSTKNFDIYYSDSNVWAIK